MAGNVSEAAEGARDIAANVQEVIHVAAETRSRAEQIDDASKDLADIAEHLNARVGIFQVSSQETQQEGTETAVGHT